MHTHEYSFLCGLELQHDEIITRPARQVMSWKHLYKNAIFELLSHLAGCCSLFMSML